MNRKDVFTICSSLLENGGKTAVVCESKTKLANTRIYVSQFNKQHPENKISCKVIGNEVNLFRKNG